MLLHLIGDFGSGDLSFSEVIQRMMSLLPEAQIVQLPVPAFSTIAAGFCMAQLGMSDAPVGTMIFQNVAPRDDDHGPRKRGAGEPLVFAELPNGVRVVGVMSGHAFSFVRDTAKALRYVNAASDGSQFRSRDIFPQAVARIARGDDQMLGEPIDRDMIPEVPTGVIAYVDGFGNIKTTHTLEDCTIEAGTEISIQIGFSKKLGVMVREQNFAVAHGELCLTPGSSGWTNERGQHVRFLEVFLRGGSAWEVFGKPPVGVNVDVRTTRRRRAITRPVPNPGV